MRRAGKRDGAAPQSIEKLRRGDVPAVESMKKVPDGIRAVAARIRTGRLKCFRTCQNLIREMGLYHYDPERMLQEIPPSKKTVGGPPPQLRSAPPHRCTDRSNLERPLARK